MAFIRGIFFVVVLALVLLGAWIWSGTYDIGADEPHWGVTARAIGMLRRRSIEAHATGISAPNLDDAQLVAAGAEHYAEMCTGCHLAPGMADTELRAGLYPQPPNLAKGGVRDPARAFWVIKHGIKMTAMPAWGRTHDDNAIWALVAFAGKLPQMTPDQYKAMTKSAGDEGHAHDEHAPGGHDDQSGGDHDRGTAGGGR